MKTFKNITIFLLVINGTLLKAHWPAGSFSSADNYRSGVVLVNSQGIFVKDLIFRQGTLSLSAQVDTKYVTGVGGVNKTKSAFRLLNWNGKVRMKLGRNMNILFSYN